MELSKASQKKRQAADNYAQKKFDEYCSSPPLPEQIQSLVDKVDKNVEELTQQEAQELLACEDFILPSRQILVVNHLTEFFSCRTKSFTGSVEDSHLIVITKVV